jgi:hypothetical protein
MARTLPFPESISSESVDFWDLLAGKFRLAVNLMVSMSRQAKLDRFVLERLMNKSRSVFCLISNLS